MKKTSVLLCLIAALSQANGSIEKNDTKAKTDSIQQSHYLPLSVGNKWVYRKTVPSGVRIFAWETQVIDEKTNFLFGPVKDINAGTFEETYVVKDQIVEDGRQRWLIDISSRTARDGRYGCLIYPRPDRILWGRLVSSGDVIEIGEIMIWDRFPDRPFQQERTLLIEPIQKAVEATISKLPPVVTTSSAKRVAVTVEAGKFDGCLEMITEVNDTDKKVWKTYSYYAPNVGLVKEEQKTPDGKSTYLLELIKYELVGEEKK